jgi:hypothetical protein
MDLGNDALSTDTDFAHLLDGDAADGSLLVGGHVEIASPQTGGKTEGGLFGVNAPKFGLFVATVHAWSEACGTAKTSPAGFRSSCFVCINPDCTEHLDDRPKVDLGDFATVKSASETYLCIQTDATTVCISPLLPVECVGFHLGQYALARRTLAQWDAVFCSLLAMPGDIDTDDKHAKFVLQYSANLGRTMPLLNEGNTYKKRRLEIISTQQSQMITPLTLPQLAMDSALAPSDPEFPTALQAKLSLLGTQTIQLQNAVLATDKHVRLADLPLIEAQLLGIRQIIGDKNLTMSRDPIHHQLNVISQQVASLQSLPDILLSRQDQEAVQAWISTLGPNLSGITTDTIKQIKTMYHPLAVWCKKQSSGAGLEGRVSRLESASPPSTSPSPPQRLPVHTGPLEARIALLEAKLALLEGKSDHEAITIGEHTFGSVADTRLWLSTHANNSVGYYLMVDPHSFLALASRTITNTSGKDLAESLSTFKKAQYESWEDGTVKQSFNWKVPEIFGKAPANGGKMLTAISTYEKFEDPTTMFTGYRYTLETAIEECDNQLSELLRNSIDPKGQEVAVNCVRDAARFSTALVAWMVKKYEDLKRINPQAPKDNWEFVSQCVRAIFEHLHNARRFGKSGDGTREEIMWATLRGRKAANEILAANFTNHQVVQNVLNLHMQRNAVTKEHFESALGKIQTTLGDHAKRIAAAGKSKGRSDNQ